MGKQWVSGKEYNNSRGKYDKRDRENIYNVLYRHFGTKDIFYLSPKIETYKIDGIINYNDILIGYEQETLTRWETDYPFDTLHLGLHKVANGLDIYAKEFGYNPKYHLYLSHSQNGLITRATITYLAINYNLANVIYVPSYGDVFVTKDFKYSIEFPTYRLGEFIEGYGKQCFNDANRTR